MNLYYKFSISAEVQWNLKSKTSNPKHLLHLLPTEDRVLQSGAHVETVGRRRGSKRNESHFVNSPWLQHIPSRLFLEGDFSASRCLPAGYASLLRNTSVSHTSCGQAHRSVLSERDGKGGAGGGKQTENRGQRCFVCNPAGAQTH